MLMPVCCLEKMFITGHIMVGTKQYAKGGCIPKPFKNCAKITTSMMTWTFLWQKLFRILWWSHFILTISLKGFAGRYKTNQFQFGNIFWHFVVMSSASSEDVEAPTTSRWKQTNFLKFSSQNSGWIYLFQQLLLAKWLK